MKKLIPVIILTLSILTSIFLYGRAKIYKEERNTYKQNTVSLLEKNSSAQLTNKELRDYIDISEDQFAKELDSVLSVNDIKIKNLNKIIQSKTIITLKDTEWLKPESIVIVDSTSYKLNFNKETNCVNAKITVLTKDKSSTVLLDDISFKNESYFIVYKEKKKWWQFFKKRRLIQKTVNNCGETVIKELEIAKQ